MPLLLESESEHGYEIMKINVMFTIFLQQILSDSLLFVIIGGQENNLDGGFK